MSAMQMKYIFLRKNNILEKDGVESSYNAIFTKMFGVLFKNVANNSFDIEVEGYLYTINFKLTSNKSSYTYYLTLFVEGKISKCAKILNEVNVRLLRGSHRKEYNIILTFDCISHYYCNKIYPKFNFFERKIRELIFFILVKSLGVDWYNATFSQELKNELTKKGFKNSDLIEKALYEMTISQLETYLFEPYRVVEAESVIDDQLNALSLSKMTKEQIIEALDMCRAKSLWERFFESSVSIDDLQTNFGIIREYRNSVAHSKYFYKDDYIKCNRILNKLINQIENAIETIEVRTFGVIDIGKSLGVLAGAVALLFAPALKTMIEASRISIPKINPQVAEQIKALSEASRISIPKINPQVAEQIKALSEATRINISKINPQVAEQIKALSEATRISFPKINPQVAEQIKALSEATRISFPKINPQITAQIKVMSEASKMINNQMAIQLKVLSETSKIDISEINTQVIKKLVVNENKSTVQNEETINGNQVENDKGKNII